MHRRADADTGPKLLAASHWFFPSAATGHWSGLKWSHVRTENGQWAASGAEATLNGSVVLFPFWFLRFRPLLKSSLRTAQHWICEQRRIWLIILLLGNLDFLSLQLSFPPLLCALSPASGQPGKFSGCLSPLGFRGLVKLRTYSPSLPVASLLPEGVIINHSGLQYPTPRNHLGNRLSFRLYGCIGCFFSPHCWFVIFQTLYLLLVIYSTL